MIDRPTRPSPPPAAPARRGALRRRPRRAFTFIEVMLVAAILAILAVVTMPNLLSATTPMPEPVGDAIEADLRRARIESISRLEPMVVVVGAARDRWWIARAAEPNEPLAGAIRVFGSGTLGPYIGHTIDIMVDSEVAEANENATIARFDQFGSRDAGQVTVTLRRFALEKEATVAANWVLEPQRTRLRAGDDEPFAPGK
ncbi:MAG: prepilin-type N-terminal cleavage/methylation domain-containing protein [Phycisphaera sp.]|nr:prepilin-type N-terminal cleavage/methylation domain-containing protein [Phycisphaera sp.]